MEFLRWLEAHESLSGWAQALGSILTLWVGLHFAGLRQKQVSRAQALSAGVVASEAVFACDDIVKFIGSEYFDSKYAENHASETLRDVDPSMRVSQVEELISNAVRSQKSCLDFPIHDLPPGAILKFHHFNMAAADFVRASQIILNKRKKSVREHDKMLIEFLYSDVFSRWSALAKPLKYIKSQTSREKKREENFNLEYRNSKGRRQREKMAKWINSMSEDELSDFEAQNGPVPDWLKDPSTGTFTDRPTQ